MTMDIRWMPSKCIDLLKLSMFEKSCYASLRFSIETQKEAGCLHAKYAMLTLPVEDWSVLMVRCRQLWLLSYQESITTGARSNFLFGMRPQTVFIVSPHQI